jgi:hypothetical protein
VLELTRSPHQRTDRAPTQREPAIGVVICAYSDVRWRELEQAVRSIERQTRPARELVIVIDHNDGLLNRARTAFPQADVVPSTGLPGLSGARNTGISRVTSSIVAFLDDDAAAAPDWLEQLAATFRDDDRVIGVGGWVEPRWEAAIPRWLAPELYWIVGCSYLGLPAGGGALRNPIGANMAFRRDVLTEVDGFREEMGRIGAKPVGDEETALGIIARARRPQSEILHVPAARVEHCVPEQRTTWRYLFSRCWHEGRSKAQLARAVGRSDALASERTYAAHVLPAGIARGLSDVLRGDPSGLGRATSIVAALAVTATGYAVGRIVSAARP